MGVVRINAIGPGAVDYLLHGCDPTPAEQVQDLEKTVEEHEQRLQRGREPGDSAEQGRDLNRQQEGAAPSGRGRWVAEQGANYHLDAVEHGEPQGRWVGSGMAAMGLPYQAGDEAKPEPLRAIFGELRYPGAVKPGSTKDSPVYLGNKPRKFATLSERVDKALKAEPDATLERQQEIEEEVARGKGRSAVAYYDVTFSPDKSVSVYYAALLAAGEHETAQAVREAHDLAVRLAIEGAEREVAWVRTGTHGAATKSGQTVGNFEPASGLVGVMFAHHTNRDGEPQLHVHAGVLNRAATADGRVYALDGNAFRPVKDAMKVHYERAFEALVGAVAPAVFETRPDGQGRQIAGIEPELTEEASRRTRLSVQPEVDRLLAEYEAAHPGLEPGRAAMKRIKQAAVLATREPKTGPAGPAAVEAWTRKEPSREERLTAAVSEVEDAAVRAAMTGQWTPMALGELVAMDPVQLAREYPALAAAGAQMATVAAELAADQPGVATTDMTAWREELVAKVLPAALETVQKQYATWNIGNFVDAIDTQLGADHGTLRLGIDARKEWLWGVAEQAVAAGHDVVRVSVGDPVFVPSELRREVDGHSQLRPHRNEQYATAEHISAEEHLRAIALSRGARHLPAEVVGGIAERARSAGLSEDQVAVVAGVLGSDRRIEILIGPAGAGKSHTLVRLASEWAEQHGGRVIGTATAQKATTNLDELGLDEAVNTYKLVKSLSPDERGLVTRRLTDRDLIVVDETGMSASTDLAALAKAVDAAGAKMVFAGDHHQLTAPGAGGMFAHLAAQAGTLELEKVHRFTSPWEREASLRLRAGDPTVAAEYANEGRLRIGTLDQMEYQAIHDFLADRLERVTDENGQVISEGVESLLIVGSNEQAARLSKDIQADLLRYGKVEPTGLARARDQAMLHVGDLIQAEKNDSRLPVQGGLDKHGQRREALPVTNRDVYTVKGIDLEARELLVEDQRGGTARLPLDYVRDHVSLAYAVTNHSAQGLTVQRGRFLVGRDTDLEALYPGLTRGWEYNVGYLVGEANPDAHDPQRIRDTKEARFIEVMGRSDMDRAAITVMEESLAEESSMRMVGDYYDRKAVDRGRTRHAALIGEYLGVGVYEEKAFPALLGQLRAVELAGHDVRAVFEQAIAQRELDSADSLSQVMHHRIKHLVPDRARDYSPEEVSENRRAALRPAWEELAEQHHARARATSSAVETMLGDLADKAHARTEELGTAQAAEPSTWAIEWLGPVPDPEGDPAGHRQWTVDAGQVAAYREYRNIPEDQVSIGEAPPQVQQLAYELWVRAADAGAGDPRAVDWRQLSDTALRATVETWEREQTRGPLQVSAERGEALELAHDARSDAINGQAQLDAMRPDDPARERLQARVWTDDAIASHAEGFAQRLEAAHTRRQEWWAATAPEREAAAGARRELDRRTPESEKTTQPGEPEQGQPQEQGQDQDGPQDQQQPGRSAPRGEQQAFDLEDAAERQGRDRFAEGFAVGRERGLREVDHEGAMTRRERDAELGRRVGAEVHAQLRQEHGTRLDPQGQLSDSALAQARLRELAAETRHQALATREMAERGQASEPVVEGQVPGPSNLGTAGNGPGEQVQEHTDPGQRAHENTTRAVEPSQVETGDRVQEPALDRDTDRATTTVTGTGASQVADAIRELRRVERETFQARTAREAAAERDAQTLAAEQGQAAQLTPRQALEALEEQAALDDEVAQRRGPSLGERSAQREQQIERGRDDGMEL